MKSQDSLPPAPPRNHFLMNPCSDCGWIFASDDEGIEHYHDAHLRCVECGFRFRRRRSLTLHIQSAHRRLTKYECELCREKFRHTAAKFRHMKSVHGHEPRPKGRPRPSASFSKRVPLDEKEKTKESVENVLECRRCSLSFVSEAEYRTHL